MYSVAVRVASAVLFLQLAFRRAWPAFAYSIEDDREARTAYARVLTYVVLIDELGRRSASRCSAPWLVRLLTSEPELLPSLGRRRPARVQRCRLRRLQRRLDRLGPLQADAGQLDRGRRSGLASTSCCASLLIPPYGMVGAAIATLAAYVVLFLGMVVYAGRVFPVAWEWRRVGDRCWLSPLASEHWERGRARRSESPWRSAAVFPLVLAPLGFYRPGEVRRLLRFVPAPR